VDGSLGAVIAYGLLTLGAYLMIPLILMAALMTIGIMTLTFYAIVTFIQDQR
jgi:hypothetical protein